MAENLSPEAAGNTDNTHPALRSFTASVHGTDFLFIPHGKERFAILLDMVNRATRSVHLFFYMFQNDNAGIRLRDALANAAARGVDVCVIVDRFGTDAATDFFMPIVEQGGRFFLFNARWNVRYLIRNHQKFLIADDAEVFTGGVNIAQPYFQPPQDKGWCDLAVQLRGKAVADFVRWFDLLEQWTCDPKAQLMTIRRILREWNPGTGPVRLLLGGPTRVPNSWARRIRRDLMRASRLDLVMAYFSPPRSFRRFIRNIGRNGTARLIMAGKSDNRTTIAAARLIYGGLLRCGVQIFEYLPQKLHMKLAVVDDMTYLGSANFDMRSIRINLELMLRIDDAELALRMRQFIDDLALQSEQITRDLYRRRSGVLAHLYGQLGWFLISVLDYTAARRLNDRDTH
ncbi:MAG: phospholipase D-like domain-containing protein [Sphingomonadaceae bacterium]